MSDDRLKYLLALSKETANDPFIHYGLFLEYKKINHVEEAKAQLDTLLKYFSNYLPAYYQAAHFFEEQQDFKKAVFCYEKGIELAKLQDNHHILAELNREYEFLKEDLE